MKKSEVKIGGIYIAKITNRIVRVRIDAVSRYGGWDGTNLDTNKKVRVKSPAKLRAAIGGDTIPAKAKESKMPKDRTAQKQRDTAQTMAAQTQDTSSTAVCPNCGGVELDEKGKCKKCHAPDVAKPKHISALDAAARILTENGQPMNAKEIVDAAITKGYWKSPKGKTPQATLYSAILREIIAKGDQSRFRKTERGKFVRA